MKRIIAGCLGLMMVLAGGVYGAELSWQEGDNLPAGLAFAPACVYNGKVYVAGGLESLSFDVEIIKRDEKGKIMPTTDFYALEFLGLSPEGNDQQPITGTWKFHIDTASIGVEATTPWFSPDFCDEDWDTINAGECWENQGYGEGDEYTIYGGTCPQYDGVAWYRKSVDGPGWTAGKIYIRFSSVDDDYTLYVNGQEVGSFEDCLGKVTRSEITTQWESGKSNLIVVRVEDKGGDGGIVGDVVLSQKQYIYDDVCEFQYSDLLKYPIPTVNLPVEAIIKMLMPGLEIPVAFSGNSTYYYTYRIGAKATVGISDKVYMGDIGEDGKVTNWRSAGHDLDFPSLYGALVAGKGPDGKDYLYSVGGSLTGGTAEFKLLDLAVGTAITGRRETDADTSADRDIVWLGADIAAFSVPEARGTGGEGEFFGSNYNKVYRAEINPNGTIGGWGEEQPLRIAPSTAPVYGIGYKGYIRDNKLCLIGGLGIAGADTLKHLNDVIYTTIGEGGSLGEWASVSPGVLGLKEAPHGIFPVEILPLLLSSLAWNDNNLYVIGGLRIQGVLQALVDSGVDLLKLVGVFTGGGELTEEDMAMLMSAMGPIMETLEHDFEAHETWRVPFANGLPEDTTAAATLFAPAYYPGACPILASCAATQDRICLTGGAWTPIQINKDTGQITLPGGITISPENLPRIDLEKDLSEQEICEIKTLDLIKALAGEAFQTDTQIGGLAANGDISHAWNSKEVDECPEGLPAGALGAPMVVTDTDEEHFIILGGLSGLSLSPVGAEFYKKGDRLTGSLTINKTALSLLVPSPEKLDEYDDIDVKNKVFTKDKPIQIVFKNEPARVLRDAADPAAVAKVKLFDLAGVEVPLSPDDYEVTADGVKFKGTSKGKDLPSGIYIYQVEIEGKFYTGAAVAIK